MIDSTWKLFLVIFSLPVMIIGMVGNIWVIWSVVRILYKTWSPINNVFKHMSFYILSLSIADLFVIDYPNKELRLIELSKKEAG